jgi:trehalose-phosphatase
VTAKRLRGIAPLLPLLASGRLGVFSDIDGTLSPIVERPEDARVTARCRELLLRLMKKGVRVALITGRELKVARSMAQLDGVAYAASHGLEYYWVDGSIEMTVDAGPFRGIIDQLPAEAANLGALGVTIEVKGAGVAFHYRRATDEAAAVAEIERVIRQAEASRNFKRIEGRKVIELLPNVDASKGSAARRLAERLGVKSIICLGDDRTDIDMFNAVRAVGKQGIEGRSVAVTSPEAVPELLEAADYAVDGVGGVEWLLGELADAVTKTDE